ncbi:MAG: DUF3021 family protein [Lachnospiraceae bacterium]|nr:DUF3021 family protein [Lachnospiraceae bacterium]
MTDSEKKVSKWERFLTKEIGIEFKACLYFFAILFFYSVYRIITGSWDASIVHMAEMIVLAYAMGYLQVYLLSGFDEADTLGIKEILYMVICTAIYAACSYFCEWFDKKLTVTLIFAAYVALTYFCAFLVYKIRRSIDNRILNEELKEFKKKLHE